MTWRFVLAVTLLCAAPAAAWAGEPQDAPPGAVAATLASLESFRSTREEATKRLQKLGPAALPALIEAFGDARPYTRTSQVVEAVIRTHELAALEKGVRDALEARPGDAARLRTLRTLSHLTDVKGLHLAVEIVAAIDPVRLRGRQVARVWAKALHRMLADGGTRRQISRALEKLPAALYDPSGRMLAEIARPETVGAIVDLLAAASERPHILLTHLARAPRLALVGVDVDEDILRRHLTAGDAATRVAAAAVAARTAVHGLVPDLIEVLAIEDPRSRAAALAALRALTGAALGSRPEAWRTWLEAEDAWGERTDLGTRLDADEADATALASALREVAAHPYAVSNAAWRPVLELIGHTHPGVRLAAVGALRAMKRLDAVPVLVSTLDDEGRTVRKAAHRALIAFTGETLGADALVWRRHLRNSR